MQDPSHGVARELLPHCHLLSSYRYPISQHVPLESISKWLLQAPKISRDTVPFFWTYLDRPVDGSIYLVWQPLAALGTNSASDGYVWAGAETVYQMEVPGGLILETFHFRTGFGPGEPLATHARKRYRLVPGRQMQPDAFQADPSLFIVHYSACEANDRAMANAIPLNMQIQQTMQTRAYLQSQGQIVRRDFILHDRQSWPTINMPQGTSRGMAGRQQPYPGPPRIPQNVAYPPPAPQYQHHPSNKRARTNPPGQSAPPAAAPSLDHGIEEEEETIRGDLFDQLTPREISYCRYKQNHEWMEEIFNSPYKINQIEPVDLGLGKPGTLGKLTEGIFEVPHYEEKRVRITLNNNGEYEVEAKETSDYYETPKLHAKSSYVAKLEPEKAEEFRKRTYEHIERTNAEIEKMKAKHAKRMAKFKAGGILTASENKLRNAVTDPEDVGPEIWRLEGRIDPDDDSVVPDGQPYNQDNKRAEPKSRVSDIVAQVEASLGRAVAVVHEVKRIQDGGLEESRAKPSANYQPSAINGPLARDSRDGSTRGDMVEIDADMGMDSTMDEGQAAGLLDQFHTGEAASASGFSSHSTPQNFSTPQAMLHHHSVTGTPSALSNVNTASPQHAGVQSQARTPQQHSYGSLDIEMGDAPEQGQNTEGASATGTDDWIVVPPGGVSPSRQNPANDSGGAQDQNTHTSTQSDNLPSAQLTSNAEAHQASSGNMTAQQERQNQGQSGSGDNGGGDFSFSTHQDDDGFGNLGGEGGGNDDLDLEMGMDLGMDDSAFGDAFHGVEGVGEQEGMGDDHGGM